MNERLVAAGVLIAALVIGSLHTCLNRGVHSQDGVQLNGDMPLELPQFTRLCFLKKISLFFYSLGRFFFSRPYRGIGMAIQIQSELSKNVECANYRTKTVYFIRHGQSVWNLTFDISRGVFHVLRSTLQLLVVEVCFFFTNDTFLYDSPLSTNGINQALEFSMHLTNPESTKTNDVKALKKDFAQKVAMFTSNLRRAQSTMMLALQDRLHHNEETITVLNELEEATRNPDCVPLSTSLKSSTIPFLEYMMLPDKTKTYSKILKRSHEDDISRLSLYEKMLMFNERIFRQPEDIIIVCGHSRWIMQYLDVFLPQQASDVEFRKRKVGNVDTLRFDVTKKEFKNGESMYMVEPGSVKLVYKNSV
ncbi:hypothetical protein X943_001680 [Babesia divergens]|uniref:Uncharacterized protein n=1 Tax=Babesia divergens TaxID=32595 RepID=A0AAD9LI73_BABDI|nr:hypothetical protein X943_001680 [Babesia divergens]